MESFNKSGFSKVSSAKEKSRIEYLLQYSVGCTTVFVKEIWNVCQPNNQFEKKNANKLKLDAFVGEKQLKDNNKLESVCNKNFDIPKDVGMVISTGHIDINKNELKDNVGQLLLVKVCVGVSYCIPKKYEDQNNNIPQQGFDSIYYYNDEDENAIQVYRHDYRIFEKEQVQPMYIVEFKFDNNKEQELEIPKCDICEDFKAEYYCIQDQAPLCIQCHQEHLNKLGQKLANKHKTVKINERPKSFGQCETHPETQKELYCQICQQSLCIYCKIQGDHSQGDNYSHLLIKISEAYAQAIRSSKAKDHNLDARKTQLGKSLNDIDKNIKDLVKNAKEIEEELYQKLKKTLETLQIKTQEKMSKLIGLQLELKRQYDHIQWIESFLKYQQETLSPSDYLIAWSRHNMVKQEILKQDLILGNIKDLKSGEPKNDFIQQQNLKLECNIQIIDNIE